MDENESVSLLAKIFTLIFGLCFFGGMYIVIARVQGDMSLFTSSLGLLLIGFLEFTLIHIMLATFELENFVLRLTGVMVMWFSVTTLLVYTLPIGVVYEILSLVVKATSMALVTSIAFLLVILWALR